MGRKVQCKMYIEKQGKEWNFFLICHLFFIFQMWKSSGKARSLKIHYYYVVPISSFPAIDLVCLA